jgi:hypothetical protein
MCVSYRKKQSKRERETEKECEIVKVSEEKNNDGQDCRDSDSFRQMHPDAFKPRCPCA